MSLFEFLMVLVSLIIGLGIAELLSGIAQTIRYRKTVTLYWVHFTFVLIIFLALLQQWWEIWGLRETETWTFIGLLMMLGGPIGLFLISHLIFPDQIVTVDFRAYYYNEMQPILWIGVCTVITSVTFRPLIFGETLFALDNLSSFVLIAIFVSLSFSRNAIYHGVMVILVLLGLMFDVLLVGLEIS